jgi:CheY-like chemotaxis protein
MHRASRPPTGAGTTGPPSVLHVDDEPLNRALVRAMFRRAADPRLNAAELREAGTLAAARAAWADRPADVVLLDVRLPDGSGLELAAELRADPGPQRPWIIALTAGATPGEQRAARASGCDAVLVKPYTVEQFETALAAALDGPGHTTGPSHRGG